MYFYYLCSLLYLDLINTLLVMKPIDFFIYRQYFLNHNFFILIRVSTENFLKYDLNAID